MYAARGFSSGYIIGAGSSSFLQLETARVRNKKRKIFTKFFTFKKFFIVFIIIIFNVI